MTEMPTLGAEYNFEIYVSTPFGEEPFEMCVTYNHYPKVKRGLEVEPCEECYEVEDIQPIFCGDETLERIFQANGLSVITLWMYRENPDQLHSILGDL